MRKIIFLFAVILFSSCSVYKKCAEPNVELPEKIVTDIESDTLCIADLHWSEIFSDTLLQALIQKTLDHNKDLLSATAHIQELERYYRVAKADQYPSFGADLYIDHETNKLNSPTQNIELEAVAKLTLAWEVDFFGRVRWSKREALANYLETVEGQRALQMTLIAEVATSYFELIALDNELSIVSHTVQTREEDLNKAQIRFEGGLTSEIPFQQAKVEYASTAALIPDLQRKIAIKENEIALLTGEMPTSIQRSEIKKYENSLDWLQIGIPSDLVKRRPDIRGAEQSLKAALANAGYAWADRFPRFLINLEGGLEHNSFQGFFKAPLTYAIGELTSPIFSFGKRKAKYEAAIKAYDAERFQYEKKTLQAFKEVNDAVISYISANKTVTLMQNLKDASKKYVELALVQYINGHISYIDVLDAQRSYLNAEVDLSNAIRDEYVSLINLYKSLGGGWVQ